ncbi:MAG: hypothetical protein RR247_00590 [Clostridia bacterium]
MEILTKSCRKKWQNSTDGVIAKVIGKSQDKEKTITVIEQLMEQTNNEQDFLDKLMEI